MYSFPKCVIRFFALGLLVAMLTACGGDASTPSTQPTQPEQVVPPTEPRPTDTLAPTSPPEPTPTLEPTATEVPTLVPTPTYSLPVVLLEFSGTGEIITDNYELPQCWKSVFYWNASPNSSGVSSLILELYNAAEPDGETLVNEFAMDVPAEGLSGSVLKPLKGGEYYFSSENTNEAWTVRVECQDNVAPVGAGMNIQANGSYVSDNYLLSTCNKSIFSWSVEPYAHGMASLILRLCNHEDCSLIVNDMKTDLTSPLTGQALEPVENGIYFIVSENTIQPWSVIWECKD